MISNEYIAGFFDGEGTFFLGKQITRGKEYPHAKIMLSQSGEDGLALLKQIQHEVGGSIYQHLKAGQYKATKDAYKLYWNKEEGIALCNMLIPHLIIKKTQAEKVLAYLLRK